MSSSLAGCDGAAHQQEDQPGDELQGNAGGRHHEGEAVQRGDLRPRAGLPSLLEDVAPHLRRLHPQHEEQQHQEEQAAW